jgi:hypothetical protein
VLVHLHADAADRGSAHLDGKSVVSRRYFTIQERARMLRGVRMRDRRDPARDLGIVTTGDDRVDVVVRPGPQHEIAVAKLHPRSV